MCLSHEMENEVHLICVNGKHGNCARDSHSPERCWSKWFPWLERLVYYSISSNNRTACHHTRNATYTKRNEHNERHRINAQQMARWKLTAAVWASERSETRKKREQAAQKHNKSAPYGAGNEPVEMKSSVSSVSVSLIKYIWSVRRGKCNQTSNLAHNKSHDQPDSRYNLCVCVCARYLRYLLHTHRCA